MLHRFLFVVLFSLCPSCVIAQDAMGGDASGEAETYLLLNVLEDHLTHSHLGVTAFTNYEKTLENEWGLSAWSAGRLSALLEEQGKKVVEIELPEARREQLLQGDYVKGGWTKVRLEAAFDEWLSAQVKAHGARGALVLRSTSKRFPPDLPAFYSGYGVMTMHGKMPKRAFLFANVIVQTIAGTPLLPLEGVRPRDSDCRSRFDPATVPIESYENLAATDLAPFKAELQELIEVRVRQDLTAANILPGEVDRCVVRND